MNENEPVTILNVNNVSTHHLSMFVNLTILSQRLPLHLPNSPISKTQLVPLLSLYANNRAYLNELYNIVYSAYFEQKKLKRIKDPKKDEKLLVDLEAKVEILYRSMQTLDRYYEACSRLMTGLGEIDPRESRH